MSPPGGLPVGGRLAWPIAGAIVLGLFLGFHRAGYGIDYAATSQATFAAVQDGHYDPFRSETNAPYPPYFYDLYRPIAGSQLGSAVSLLLNLLSIPVLMAALGASPWAAVLLLLTPQQITNAFLNNPQFIALFGFALLVWTMKRPQPVSLAASGLLLALKPNQFLLAPLALLTWLPVRALGLAALITAVFTALTFLIYGFWVPTWLEYGTTTTLVSGDYDNLLLALGLSGASLWAARMLIIGAFAVYLWRSPDHPSMERLTVAIAASNLLGFHANIISTLPLLALTFAQVPLRWSAVLVGVEWLYALAAFNVTGRQVFGFFGVVPLVCLVLIVLARRVVPDRAAEEDERDQRM